MQAHLKFLKDKATKESYDGNAISTPWKGTQEMLRDQNRGGTEFAEIVLKKHKYFRDAYLRKICFKNQKYLENRAHAPFCR